MPADQGYLDQLNGTPQMSVPLSPTPGNPIEHYDPNNIGGVASQYGSNYSPSGALAEQPQSYWHYSQQSAGPGSWDPLSTPPANIPGQPGFTQIDDYYKSLIPVYQQRTNEGINSAMASAGFGGTRYGSAAANAAAQVGGQMQNQLNSQIAGMSQGQINSDLDRALQKYIADQQARTSIEGASIGSAGSSQAAYYNYLLGQKQLEQKANQDALDYSLGYGRLGLDYYNAGENAHEFAMQQPWQAALQQNQLFQGQINPLMQYGQWEQGRQDDYGRWAYQDFENNKYGMLPMLGGWAAGIGAGSPGQITQIQTNPGQPSQASQILPWAQAIMGLFG